MIQEEWLVRYETRPKKFDRILQSWDTASKTSELSDFSVCTTWGIIDRHFYLLHVFRKRLGFPELKRAVIDQRGLFNANVVLIEDKGSGTSLIQDLVADGIPGITKYEPEDDKVMRANTQTAVIENGFVHVPGSAPWLEDYIHELTVFPNGQFDDQVDSTTQALDWHRSGGRYRGWMEYYQQELKRMGGQVQGQNGTSAPLQFCRMRAPRPHANYYLSGTNGRAGRYSADEHGFIENVHPDDIAHLERQGCKIAEPK